MISQNSTQQIKTGAQLMFENPKAVELETNLKLILTAANIQAEVIMNAKSNYLPRGGQIVSLNPVDIRQTWTEALLDHKSMMTRKELSVESIWPEDHILVLADRSSLQHQVLSNILSNAIKFSHS